MGCDDVPDSLFPKLRRDPTMADIEALEERVEELERLVARLYKALRSGPVRFLVGDETSSGHTNWEAL